MDKNTSLSTPGQCLSFCSPFCGLRKQLLSIILFKSLRILETGNDSPVLGSEPGSAEAGGLEEPKIRGTREWTNLRKAILNLNRVSERFL